MMQVHLGGLQNREIGVLAMYLSGQRRVPDSGDGAPPDEAGRLLYSEGNAARQLSACATCHGKNSDTTRHSSDATAAMAIPRLTGQHGAYIEEQLYRFVDGTRQPGQSPNHPVANQLDDEDIRALTRYLSRVE